MFSVAMLSILLSAAATAPLGARTAVAQADDPAIKVSLNHRSYDRGDRARVNIKVRDDGYVVVLQLRADGLVRVLYPLDPGNDDFVRGNQSYEVRGRGDREAFTVESASGTGTVYAAWSAVPAASRLARALSTARPAATKSCCSNDSRLRCCRRTAAAVGVPARIV